MNKFVLSPAKIGNSNGFRLPSEFFQKYPQFKNAKGRVEVVSENIFLVVFEPEEPVVEEENSLMLKLFLDFLMKETLANPESSLVYTQAMSDEEDELLTGVELDNE